MRASLDLAERLATIVVVQQEIAGAVSDQQALMKLIVDRARDLTGAESAMVGLVDGDDFVVRAINGTASSKTGVRIKIAESLSGKSIQSGQVLKCDDAEIDPRVDKAAARQLAARSVISAPLIHDKKTVGVLNVIHSSKAAFDDFDVYSLQLIAGFLAAAMSHAAEFEAKQASEQRYRMLFERNVAGVFRTTVDGRILDCNQSMASMLGYDSREELLSRRSWDLYEQPSDRERYLSVLQQEKALTNYKLLLKRKDGSPLQTLVTATIFPGDQGEEYVLGTIVTDH